MSLENGLCLRWCCGRRTMENDESVLRCVMSKKKKKKKRRRGELKR